MTTIVTARIWPSETSVPCSHAGSDVHAPVSEVDHAAPPCAPERASRVSCSGRERRTTASTAYMPTSRIASSAASRPAANAPDGCPGWNSPSSRRSSSRISSELRYSKPAQSEQVAEHAQHLPRRPRFTRRPGSPGHALPATLDVDPGAGRLGKRRDRQDHGGAGLLLVARERRQGHDALGALQRRLGRPCRREVGRLDAADQQVTAQSRVQHFSGGQPGPGHRTGADAAMRRRAGQRGSNRVRAFGQVAQPRTGHLGQRGGQGADLGARGVTLGERAQQDQAQLALPQMPPQSVRGRHPA